MSGCDHVLFSSKRTGLLSAVFDEALLGKWRRCAVVDRDSSAVKVVAAFELCAIG